MSSQPKNYQIQQSNLCHSTVSCKVHVQPHSPTFLHSPYVHCWDCHRSPADSEVWHRQHPSRRRRRCSASDTDGSACLGICKDRSPYRSRILRVHRRYVSPLKVATVERRRHWPGAKVLAAVSLNHVPASEHRKVQPRKSVRHRGVDS